MTAFERITDAVTAATGKAPRGNASQRMAVCPAHEDSSPSLSITAGTDRVLLKCHANCETEDILTAINLTMADLFDEPKVKGAAKTTNQVIAEYPYIDEQGTLLFQVVRLEPKSFRQRKPDGTGGWSWSLGDTRRVLYRLPQVIEAVGNGFTIYVCEGEKDVHTLENRGYVATCNAGGAGKWRDEYSEFLRDADVVLIADRDETGQAHCRQIAASLADVAAHVRIVEAFEGKDVTDHFTRGHDIEKLVETWNSDQPTKADLAPDLWEFIGASDPPMDWVIPDLLERGDRLIWTGFEGLGKSMFVRQLAVMAAAGLDPFSAAHVAPRKVLLIDCENSERQSRRKFRPLAHATVSVDRDVPEGGLRLIHKPQGIDLARDEDAAWLLERVTAHRPDLLIIGPFYRLHAADMKEETAARRAASILDLARTTVDCALVVEAHAGHGEQGKNRSVRPIGSSLLLRWPEFGYGIAPAERPHGDATCTDIHQGRPCPDATRVVDVKAWRGPRDERNWPDRLTWGQPWPWVVDPREGRR